jgi:hypothetical protein
VAFAGQLGKEKAREFPEFPGFCDDYSPLYEGRPKAFSMRAS